MYFSKSTKIQVILNFFNQLTGSTAVKFPEQLQMQDLHSQPTEEVKFR